MVKTFVISDTHFGHEATCTVFKKDDGTPLRPFANAEEMDAAMIERWNDVVKEEDKVYHLGDVAMKKPFLKTIKLLKGRKTLIMGNHDIFNTKEYIDAGFENVRAYRVLNGKNGGRIILSHIPIHESCLGRFSFNVHGHLHINNLPDPRYINVSVEQIDFTPIDIQGVLDRC
jgi:calcineurin-like phosphoesterase family protein